jgi:hypothetical protein
MNRPEQQPKILVSASASQNASATVNYSANSSETESDLDDYADEPFDDTRGSDGFQFSDGLHYNDQNRPGEGEQVTHQLIKQKNREHAKNTRVRRKNYIEALKEDIQNIINVRESRDGERKGSLCKVAAQVWLM